MSRTAIRDLQRKSYNSGNQIITSGGQLILAHSLNTEPSTVFCWLKCVIANLGYSVGDKVSLSEQGQPNNQGISIVADSVNLTVRFGSSAGAFALLNKTTAATGSITNADWRIIIQAWA